MSVTFEKVLVLKNVSLFAESSESALADLITAGEEKTYRAGSEIIASDEKNNALYVILSGAVHLRDGETFLGELGVRQYFGETTVFAPARLPYSVLAYEQTTVLKFDANRLYQMMALHSSLALGFLAELSGRLQHLEMRHE